jgi:cytoskeletal protein CcmA (bactofilin family)
MWKWTRKRGDKLAPPSLSPAPVVVDIPSLQVVPKLRWVESFRPGETYIGKSIMIKGDVSGGGNVYWDGELEGSVELQEGAFAVGPEGRVRANLQAPSIVVLGRVDGNLHSFERTELKKSAIVVGDIHTPRIAIEDGASLEGKVQVHQDLIVAEPKISSISKKSCG